MAPVSFPRLEKTSSPWPSFHSVSGYAYSGFKHRPYPVTHSGLLPIKFHTRTDLAQHGSSGTNRNSPYQARWNMEVPHIGPLRYREEHLRNECHVWAGSTHRPFDYIIWATGFQTRTSTLTHMNTQGKNGLTFGSAWNQGVRNHLGIATHGFPNLF